MVEEVPTPTPTPPQRDEKAKLSTPESEPSPATRRKSEKKQGFWATVLEYGTTVVVALLIAVLVKTFLVQPFFIPSASMRPTLVEQDKILVSKLHPGVMDIERGDVIVFQDPDNWVGADPNAPLSARQHVAKILSHVGLAPDPSENHLVKRLIGKGGDHVQCTAVGGPVSVNGTEISEPYISPESGACTRTFDVTVPRGKLWVMGDNRSHSADSAYHEGLGGNGFVDESLVTGKAFLVFMPFDHWGTLDSGKAAFAGVPAPGKK